MKLKPTIFFFMILFVTDLLWGLPVNLDSCRKAAESKLVDLDKSGEFSIKEILKLPDNNKNDDFHVFILDPQGYIITTNQTELPPIIAYSFSNNLEVVNEKNPFLDFLKTDLKLRFENLSAIPEKLIEKQKAEWERLLDNHFFSNRKERFEQWPPEGTTPTGGWLQYTWTQSPPYNNLCPMDPVTGSRSIAGCPSIAMAQILDFNRTTNGVSFDDSDDYYHNYAGRQYWIDDDHLTQDFPSFPELNTYLDTLACHYLYEAAISNTDKAALVFACGVAAEQVYTSQASGTFGVDQAYAAYQKFNFEDVQLIDETTPDFYEQIAQNIIDESPVHLAAVTPQWDAGHNFVIDGYNTDEYYHLNMGWGGTYNGWYLLPDEIPYGLTVIEGAIVDILPTPLPTGFISGEITLSPAVVDTALITVEIQNLVDEFTLEIEAEVNGTATFSIELPIGIYTITAAYPGYETIIWNDCLVEEQQNSVVSFLLCELIPPTDLSGVIVGNDVTLNWQYDPTRDFQYFKIFRNINGTVFTLLDTTDQLFYNDFVDYPQSLIFGYYVTAVYSQDNASAASNEFYLEYTVASEENEVPISVHNLSNYPNPFNPETTIEFSIEPDQHNEQIKLEIYNIKGQRVKQLISDQQSAGQHSVVWDGTDDKGKPVTSGVYFYQLKSGENVLASEKCLLLK